MKKTFFLLPALWLALLLSCTTAPYTGRGQLMLVSEGQEVGLGEEAYRHILRDSVVSDNPEALRIVRKVGERIAQAANKPEYKWEFRVINDPDMVNAFCVPGGKVAVYTGIFPIARDEAGLAVVLGHEVAHALLRHAGERISQSQVVGAGLALAGASGINPQLLQAFGLGASVGVILPFGRSQESEADHVGLILMAKAGYDPRVSVEVWERMERKEKGAPPEFLSTHPSYETRTQQLRAWMPEALKYYRPVDRFVETLPSVQTLDSASAKAERELLKRIQAINARAGDQRGERAVIEAIGYSLRTDPAAVYQERQQLQIGYGQYAALRGLSALGKSSLRRVVTDYQRGISWSNLAESQGTRIVDLISWMGDLLRTTTAIHGQTRVQPFRPGYRTP
ncbi:MAG TPA: M48 family metallopeptidase [Candidatus Binatia bacterium]|jgi:predicted Zn-dependent protease|nr:M48 family metallopeptidase [Candidatus Binatia bacterium]